MSVKDKLPWVAPAPVPALVLVPVIPSSVGNANPNPSSDPGVNSTWPRNLVLLSPYPWVPQQALQSQPHVLIMNDTDKQIPDSTKQEAYIIVDISDSSLVPKLEMLLTLKMMHMISTTLMLRRLASVRADQHSGPRLKM